MLYRPREGHMWDTSIVYHENKYYLFSMYETAEETAGSRTAGTRFTDVWCAVSDDGVHWSDVGSVIREQPTYVMKMFVRRLGERFVMNFGSSSETPPRHNDTLRFWESEDLVTWRPFRENGEIHPDPRWYRTEGRWDHMYMLPDEVSGGYLGYCVATPHERYPYTSCGLLHSDDGSEWRVLPPPVVEWGATPPVPMFEVGGCEREAGRYYLIGGTVDYGGDSGYGVYTLVSDHANGPFRPDTEAYRLCGTTGRSGLSGMQWLASFARGVDDELLITNYLTDDLDKNVVANAISRGHVWFLPIKRAVIDADGHLRMGYWEQNERLKGPVIEPGTAALVERHPVGSLVQEGGRISLDVAGDRSGDDAPPDRFSVDDRFAIAVFEPALDVERGAVVEGTLTIEADERWRPSKAGFYVEEDATSGSYLLLEANDPRWRTTEIGGLRWDPALRLEPQDLTRYGAATVTGTTNGREHRFRILLRRNIVEVYIDDLLVQTFITDRMPSGRIGFIVQNARCSFDGVRIWEMSLERWDDHAVSTS